MNPASPDIRHMQKGMLPTYAKAREMTGAIDL